MKIYTLEIRVVAMVLAEDEAEARGLAHTVLDTEAYPYIYLSDFDGTLPMGWTEKTLIYHEGDEDITVREAIDMTTPPEPPQPHPDQMTLELEES